MPARQTVVVLGASDNPERYSNKAVHELRSRGHLVIPVNPRLIELEGLAVRAGLSEIDEPVDTLSVYLGPAVSGAQLDAILALRPGRVIFNPGSENPELMAALRQAGIAVEEACTLVLLRTGQF